MAESTDLDELLHDSFARIAAPGDSDGVAEIVRARLDSGDTGATAPGPRTPGWHAGPTCWLPWAGLAVAGMVVGAVCGASGLLGAPHHPVALLVSTTVLERGVDADSCPGGPVVHPLSAGTRVLAVERSSDGAAVALRDPDDLSQVVWVDAADAVVDRGEPPLSSLPVGPACPVARVVAPSASAQSPAPTSPEPKAPAPKPPVVPAPKDTVVPTLTGASASHDMVCADPKTGWASTVTVTVSASDNVGVAGVRVTWAGADTGSHDMTMVGGKWTSTYDPPSGTNGQVTFSMIAKDVAGNQSSPATATTTVYPIGNCLG